MVQRERDILERAVRVISEKAASASGIVDEALAAGLAPDHPVTLQAKMLRLELLSVKADLERELGKLVLNCAQCGMEVHWIPGIAISAPGHWGHRRPAPHGEPVLSEGQSP